MPLCDYFLATKSEVKTLAATGEIPAAFPRIEAKGFDVVPIKVLAEMLGTGDDGVEPGDPVASAEDYEWFVLKITGPLVTSLAAMDETDIKVKGASIAKIEELRWPAKAGQSLLSQLHALAQQARKTKKDMYLWAST